MKKKLISILIANLFVAAPVLAQEALKVEGSVNLGGIYNSEDAVDPSKMNDIRDLSNGVLFGWDVKGRSNRYWFDFFGENIGRDDQYVNLKGGSYEAFKYRLYSDSLRRNQLEGGRTPYAGAGGATNTATFPQLNPDTWNSVDVGYDRRDDGGYFEFSGASPWYFRVDANQVTQSGGKIGASSQGMSPGNGYVDLVFPTEYKTRNATGEAGYATKAMQLSLSYMVSRFDNDTKEVTFTNGFYLNGTDRVYMPGDNDYTRIAANAIFRQLPLGSTLAFRYTQDELESNSTLTNTILHGSAAAGVGQLSPGASSDTFEGNVENKTLAVSLTSAPMKGLDTRLYYNKLERDDNSTHVTFTNPAITGTTVYENELYSYEKEYWGFDAFYRINRQNRVGAGYENLEIERTRFDFDQSTEKRWFVEWKTSMIEGVSARLKYQELDRESNFLLGNEGTGPSDAAYANRYLKAFDATNLEQKKWKLTLDASPVEFLDLSFEANWKDNKYYDNYTGRPADDRREYYASISYGDPSVYRFTVFGDWEDVTYEQRHRVTPRSGERNYDPTSPNTATNYTWDGQTTEDNQAYGLALDVPVNEKLKLSASWTYVKSDGSDDFNYIQAVPDASQPINNTSFDDSKRRSFNLKGVYNLSKTLSFTAGWTYEKYDYKDVQVDGYRYTVPANPTVGAAGTQYADSYLMGYMKDTNYKANIFYGWVSWKF